MFRYNYAFRKVKVDFKADIFANNLPPPPNDQLFKIMETVLIFNIVPLTNIAKQTKVIKKSSLSKCMVMSL